MEAQGGNPRRKMNRPDEAGRRSLLGRNSFVYAIGSVLGMAGSLVLLPFVTRALGPSAYGALELFNRTADIVVVLALLGMRQAFVRKFYDHNSEDWQARVASTTLIFVLVVGVLALTSGLAIGLLLPEVGRDFGFGPFVWLLLGATIATQLVFQISTVFMQIRHEAVKFVVAQLAMVLLYVASALLALYVFDAGARGVVIAHLLASATVGVICAIYLVSKCGIRFDRPVFASMLAFGIPFLPATALGIVWGSADRYFLLAHVPLEQIGIYSLAAKVSSAAMVLVSTPLGRVWGPFVFEAARDPKAASIIGRAIFAYILVTAIAAAGTAALAPVVLPLLASQSFAAAIFLVPIFCLNDALSSISNVTDSGVLISGKTWLKPLVTGSGAVVSVLMLFVLVPEYGIYGAAAASTLGTLAVVIMSMWISNRCFPVKLPSGRILLTVVWVGAVLVVTANVLHKHVHPLFAAMLCSAVLLAGLFAMRRDLRVSYAVKAAQ